MNNTFLWEGITWSEGVRMMWLLVVRGMVIGFSLGIPGWTVVYFLELNPVVLDVFILALSPIIWPIMAAQLLRKQFKGFRLQIVRDPTRDPN